MIIDCGRCVVRGAACADCVVTFLTIETRGSGPVRAVPPAPVELDRAEQDAIELLASSGLVPPLRLVPERDGAGRRTG